MTQTIGLDNNIYARHDPSVQQDMIYESHVRYWTRMLLTYGLNVLIKEPPKMYFDGECYYIRDGTSRIVAAIILGFECIYGDVFGPPPSSYRRETKIQDVEILLTLSKRLVNIDKYKRMMAKRKGTTPHPR